MPEVFEVPHELVGADKEQFAVWAALWARRKAMGGAPADGHSFVKLHADRIISAVGADIQEHTCALSSDFQLARSIARSIKGKVKFDGRPLRNGMCYYVATHCRREVAYRTELRHPATDEGKQRGRRTNVKRTAVGVQEFNTKVVAAHLIDSTKVKLVFQTLRDTFDRESLVEGDRIRILSAIRDEAEALLKFQEVNAVDSAPAPQKQEAIADQVHTIVTGCTNRRLVLPLEATELNQRLKQFNSAKGKLMEPRLKRRLVDDLNAAKAALHLRMVTTKAVQAVAAGDSVSLMFEEPAERRPRGRYILQPTTQSDHRGSARLTHEVPVRFVAE